MTLESQPFAAGDSFRYTVKREPHLWAMISDPEKDDSVLIVNLTTVRNHSDKTCVLGPGDHPFVRHATCINYADAEAPTVRHLADFAG